MHKKTLLIVDGHNVFIRAYSGLKKQDLRNSEGFPTYGIYGALVTIAGMIRRYEPTHVLVAFDQGRSSKRTAMDPKYKANRIKSKQDQEREGPDEFRPQLELFFEVCHRLGIPHLRLKDVEADDIIAKAVTNFSTTFEQVVIVSADHDIQQLIRENVRVVKPSLGQSRGIKEEVFDIDSVRQEWGVDPWRLPEIWALTGDKGDNVDGIPGIGPKKAIKLMQEYGDLETILSSGDPKVVDHLDTVRLAFKLIELKGEDKIPFPPLGNLQFQPVEYGSPHSREVEELFSYFELNSINDRWIKGTLWREPKLGKTL